MIAGIAIRVEISTDMALLDVLRAVVRFRAGEAGFLADEAERLALAITETAANIIHRRHEEGSDGRLALELRTFSDRLELLLEGVAPGVASALTASPSFGEARPNGDAGLVDCAADVCLRERGVAGVERLRIVKYLPKKVCARDGG